MPTAASEHRLPFYILLLVIAASPWPLGSNRDWAWPVLAILIGLVTLGLLYSRLSKIYRSGKIVLIAFALLIAFMLFQLFGLPGLSEPVTHAFHETRLELARTVMYMAFFFAIIQLVNSEARCRLLVTMIVVMGLLQALLGGAQQLMFDLPRARGSFPNPNHFAGYLEVALCLAIGAMLADTGSSHKGRDRILEILTGPLARLRLVIVIMVIALVMSRSRMGNLAFFSSLLLTAAMAFYFSRSFNRSAALLLLSILAIDLLVISNYFGIEQLEQRFRNTATESDTRIDLQHYNVGIIKDHAWFGTGAGSYEIAFAPYRDAHIRKKVTHAENDYLELLVELGFLGVIPLLVILTVGIHAQIQLLGTKLPVFERGIAFGCLAGTLSLLIHGTADVNLQIPANALLFVLLLAIPVALRQADYKPDRRIV